jgi:hypothetical protein
MRGTPKVIPNSERVIVPVATKATARPLADGSETVSKFM